MSYTPEMVALLLPAVWDSGVTQVRNPHEPDPDMPKVKADPKLSGTILAMLADIRSAWKCAPLVHEDRVALFLTYAVDWSQQEVADVSVVDRSTVSRRLARGLNILLFTLNGKEWEDNDEGEVDDGTTTTMA